MEARVRGYQGGKLPPAIWVRRQFAQHDFLSLGPVVGFGIATWLTPVTSLRDFAPCPGYLGHLTQRSIN